MDLTLEIIVKVVVSLCIIPHHDGMGYVGREGIRNSTLAYFN
jgi:hypothetical protein